MKLFSYGKDGGPESTVSGFWLVEIKSLFSIVLLKFENGSREAYHEHAFNAVSWLLSGALVETLNGRYTTKRYFPSFKPIVTKRDTFHKVASFRNSWVLSFRGPWKPTWKEEVNGKTITLTHGRKEV